MEKEYRIMNLFEKIFGTHSQRELKLIQPKLDKILSLQSTMAAMSEEELKGRQRNLKPLGTGRNPG